MNGNTHGVKGTQMMEMIAPRDIPCSKKITYASMVCDYRPLKSEPHRCRLVVGGDNLPYDNDSAAPATNLLETKILLNSTINQLSAQFMTIVISNFSCPLTWMSRNSCVSTEMTFRMTSCCNMMHISTWITLLLFISGSTKVYTA